MGGRQRSLLCDAGAARLDPAHHKGYAPESLLCEGWQEGQTGSTPEPGEDWAVMLW